MNQLSLPFLPTFDEISLKEYFQKTTSKTIHLTLTSNTVSMLSIREKESAVLIRLHSMFLNAGSDVLDEIGAFINRKRRPTPRIKEFIHQNKARIEERQMRDVHSKPQGRYYNLSDMFEELNREYFSNSVSSAITWGNKSQQRTVRKRRLGSYQRDRDIIRINHVLDSKRVPRYFVEFIVYHEMLHAALALESGNTRQRVHSLEFKRRERLFKNYALALQWEERKYGF
jgi:predicted metal-dependent hydrolase